MVKCYLISTPRSNRRTIFEDKLWGFPAKYKSTWRKLRGEYTLFLERRDDGYWIIGGGIVKDVFEDYDPNPKWGEKTGKSRYPLRIEFESVFEIDPAVHSSKYFKIDVSSFTVLEDILPSELEKYFVESRTFRNRDIFKLLTRISEAIVFEDLEVSEKDVALLPPLLLKPILDEVSNKEFEDICCIALRILGFEVEHLGYKREYEPVWDLEIKKKDKPVIIDVKNSKSYYLKEDERRKLKDYAEKKWKEEDRPTDMILIAIGFDNSGVDKLKELKKGTREFRDSLVLCG